MGEQSQVRVALVLPSDLREWLAVVLEPLDRFEVVFSTDDGLECLAALPRFHPEIVVLGMALSGIDGIETVKRIKNEHPTPRCLVLNQYVALSDRVALAGAEYCLTLPCTGKAVLRTLEELVSALIQ